MLFPALASVRAASILTTAGACCGATAVAFASRGQLALAASAIGFAILFDFLDGFVARTLDQTSPFGARLDSLADAVSFCVAPPLIAWLSGFDGWGTPLLVGYFACGVWRLAYFDVTGLDGDGRFTGVPTTNAACWWTMIMAGVQILSPSAPVRAA